MNDLLDRNTDGLDGRLDGMRPPVRKGRVDDEGGVGEAREDQEQPQDTLDPVLARDEVLAAVDRRLQQVTFEQVNFQHVTYFKVSCRETVFWLI